MRSEAVKKPPACDRRRGNGNGGEARSQSQFDSTRSVAPRQAVYVGRKRVGHVEGGIFVKSVRGSVHQLRRPPAWALDLQSLADAERAGATTVELRDTESGVTYRASIATIRSKGFVFNRGYGLQIALPLSEWRVTRPGEVDAQQLSLFVGVTP